MIRKCIDCGANLTGHATPERCRSCAARARYVRKHGSPPEIIIAKCEVCRKEFSDYATNRKKKKHGVLFCSPICRASWVGVHNSIRRGGDGKSRTKAEKDAIDYRRHSEARRAKVRDWYHANRAEILSALKQRTRHEKAEVIEAYGGKCVCCGERHIEFLTIDHTDGSGATHRRSKGKGRGIYRDLKRRGFPKEKYQVLCLNCNISLGFYGYCPHNPLQVRTINKTPGKNTGRKGRPRTVK